MKQERDFTQFMYRLATEQSLSFQEVVEQLKQNAYTRSIRETLGKYAGQMEDGGTKILQKYLIDALMENCPSEVKRDSVEKKVRMWMKDDVHLISKESAIQLSFALKLPVNEANGFLCRVCGEGFHWRSPEELVYLFALQEGMNYWQALELCKTMRDKGLMDGRTGDPKVLTRLVRKDAECLDSTADLEEYLRQMQGSLGALHNTAYQLFRGYLDLLASPKTYDTLEPTDTISIRKITDTYLHEKLIPRVKKKVPKETKDSGMQKNSGVYKEPEVQDIVLSALQRDVRQNWPDEITLSKMKNRKTDVSRKALILLFLATDGDTAEAVQEENEILLGFGSGEWESERGAEFMDETEDMYERLNTMLADCGFAPLDARSPFDWMVLYCICGGESFYMDGRVRQFLAEVFPAPETEQ